MKQVSDRIVILGRILGSLGMVAILSTILTYVLTRELGWMIYAKLIFGTVAATLYFITNSAALSSFFGSRSTLYTAISAVTTGAFLVALAAANFFGVAYNREVDFTVESIFTLSDQTENVLGRLNQDVTVLAFFRPEEPERAAVEDILGRYQTRTPHLKLTFINPERDPEAVRNFQITQSGQRIVFQSGDQETKVSDLTEEELTNAIVRVALRSKKKILFLVGHDEADSKSAHAEGYADAANALVAEGYEIDTVTLVDKTAVPEGTGAVIIVAPQKTLLQPEIDMLHGYLVFGGHVMVMLEPGFDGGLTKFLADWRIGIGDDTMVVDPNPMSRAFGFGPDMPIVQKLEKHAITRGMKASVAFPSVRSVNGMTGAVEGVSATEVVRTSADSWGETKYGEGEASKDAQDLPGPVPIMTVATKSSERRHTKESNQGRLLVVGDHQFASNRFLPMLGNKDLFLNAVNWLVQEEDRISIRPKLRGSSRVLITENEATFIKFFAIDLVPMVLLAVGVAVWQVRRRK
jgi:ABC-type uncharacterized transport system involved in gliding motility auxiliary subunit